MIPPGREFAWEAALSGLDGAELVELHGALNRAGERIPYVRLPGDPTAESQRQREREAVMLSLAVASELRRRLG